MSHTAAALFAAFLAGVVLTLATVLARDAATRVPEPVPDGPLAFAVRDNECGLIAVRGDHADWLADGQYCRVRLAVENTDRFVHPYDTARQQVVDADGRTYTANLNAVQISDQPTTMDIKAGNYIEFDVWFDVPEDAQIVAAVLHGDDDGRGVRIPLR